MNDSEQTRLRKLLHQTRVPGDLAARLHADLDRQAAAAQGRGRRRLGAMAVAASLLLAVAGVMLQRAPSSPALIAQALAHSHEEAGLLGVVDSEFEHWRTQAGIALPPDGVQLQLAKHCRVGGRAVRHLRLASETTGTLDVLIDTRHDATWPSPTASQGNDERHWLTVTPREGLAMLVLYAPDAAPQQVRRLVQSLVRGDASNQA